ncbi:hypothetical protein BDZ89DRAFT_1160378 [Hymenopellis radicata]|nr:hypothetical protein BDZ89DRAFT_1160378 [Hymenopellis radicata]
MASPKKRPIIAASITQFRLHASGDKRAIESVKKTAGVRGLFDGISSHLMPGEAWRLTLPGSIPPGSGVCLPLPPSRLLLVILTTRCSAKKAPRLS